MLFTNRGIMPLSHNNAHNMPWSDGKIIVMPPTGSVCIPCGGHIGKPAIIIVEKGEYVKKGQLIAKADGFISANIHASVAGTVSAIEKCTLANGSICDAIRIENDFTEDAVFHEVLTSDVNKTDIINRIAECGIVGMGGAAFPMAVKLSSKDKIDTLIINGAECEPYLSADNAIMIHNAYDIIQGALLMQKAIQAEKLLIAIEDNKPEAIKVMQNATKNSDITIKILPHRYPMGAEKQLINYITKRIIKSGSLPSSVGVLVQNVASAYAVYNAVHFGIPTIERVLTIADISNNTGANLLVRIGTSIKDIIAYMGYNEDNYNKILLGGPMMGFSIASTLLPVTKGTSGILLLKDESLATAQEQPCIRCGRCANACPMGLLPMQIDAYCRINEIDKLEAYRCFDCIECGCCTFVCPAKRHLTQSCRISKKACIDRRAK